MNLKTHMLYFGRTSFWIILAPAFFIYNFLLTLILYGMVFSFGNLSLLCRLVYQMFNMHLGIVGTEQSFNLKAEFTILSMLFLLMISYLPISSCLVVSVHNSTLSLLFFSAQLYTE